MCALAGSAGDTAVALADAEVVTGGAGVRTAIFRVANDRKAYRVTNSGTAYLYDWLASYADPANYEARVTLLSGGPVGGVTGSWVSLASTTDWSVQDPSADGEASEATISIAIRNATTTIIVDSATIALAASRIS